VKDPEADFQHLKPGCRFASPRDRRPLRNRHPASPGCVLDQIHPADQRGAAADPRGGCSLRSERGYRPDGGSCRGSCRHPDSGRAEEGLLEAAAWPCVGRLEIAAEVGLAPCPHASGLWWTLPEDFTGFPPRRAVAGHKGITVIWRSSQGAWFPWRRSFWPRGGPARQPGSCPFSRTPPPMRSSLRNCRGHVQSWRDDLDFSGRFTAVLIGPGLAAGDLPGEMKRMARRL